MTTKRNLLKWTIPVTATAILPVHATASDKPPVIVDPEPPVIIEPEPAVCSGIDVTPVINPTSGNVNFLSSFDLANVSAINTPDNAVLTWHNATPATSDNQLSSLLALAGTYYAAFYYNDNGVDCYSGPDGDGSKTAEFLVVNT